MILTVCMSPSVDVTIELDALNVGKVNIVKNKTLSFTGKSHAAHSAPPLHS